ncbi:MAG: glucosaminidase domain-containing protein [Hyphomicrobiaceae bacterium]
MRLFHHLSPQTDRFTIVLRRNGLSAAKLERIQTRLRTAPLLLAIAACMWPPTASAATRLPEIRIHFHNRVPDCVTPERLMAFLKIRNERLPTRFRDIAKWYRHHGEALQVRWDYAFFQMALETNFLTYRRGNGRPGDVRASQNNFAGIGATGGGVAGERFPDVGTGVLAQIEHLVVYSGEKLDRPVARRTALVQNDVAKSSRRLKRPVRFSDLTRRWAADPRYATSIASIAGKFNQSYCNAKTTNDNRNRKFKAAGLAAHSEKRSHLIGPRRHGQEPAMAKQAMVPHPVPANRETTHSRQIEPTEPGQRLSLSSDGMLSGLQGLARNLTSRLEPEKITPPRPRPASYPSQVAANN